MRDMNPLIAASSWAPVVQTAIGAIAAIGGGAFAQSLAWQKDRRALAAAFAGEIRCVVKARNWRLAPQVIAEGKVPRAEASFPIFEANVAKIGLLPVDLAGKIALFYSDLAGVFLDFKTLHGAVITREIRVDDEFKDRLVEDLNRLGSEANALIDELGKESARRWRW